MNEQQNINNPIISRKTSFGVFMSSHTNPEIVCNMIHELELHKKGFLRTHSASLPPPKKFVLFIGCVLCVFRAVRAWLFVSYPMSRKPWTNDTALSIEPLDTTARNIQKHIINHMLE